MGEAGAEAFLIQRLAGRYRVAGALRASQPGCDGVGTVRLEAVSRRALLVVRAGTKSGGGTVGSPAANAVRC